MFSDALSDPARIQTWNLLIRSQILYSVELRGHPSISGGKYKAKSSIEKRRIVTYSSNLANTYQARSESLCYFLALPGRYR